MSEDTGTQTGTQQGGQVVVDKNKSAEQYIKEAEGKYIVPELIRNKFPDLVKLIYETESMNAEEREYWLQIMPIMTEDQIVKFREILVNEKQQLTQLDQEYQQEMSKAGSQHVAEINEAEMRRKKEELAMAEQQSEDSEQSEEENLLKALDNL